MAQPATTVRLTFVLLGVVGFLDYFTGGELSFSVFYLIPVCLVAWTCGRVETAAFAVCSALLWWWIEWMMVTYSVPVIVYWNAAVRLCFFLMFGLLLNALRDIKQQLELTVERRTLELRQALLDLRVESDRRLAEEARRRQAEHDVLHAAEHEQQRIGSDLHDSVQGSLAGAKMMLLALRSSARKHTDSLDPAFEKLSNVLTETIEQTRAIARNLCPSDLSEKGLRQALQQLAETTTGLFHVECSLDYTQNLHITDETVAAQLYYITREAVNNALKHANAKRIDIRLTRRNAEVVLEVEDDGDGFREFDSPSGLGMRTMFQRAIVAGGSLQVHTIPDGGTRIECVLTAPDG